MTPEAFRSAGLTIWGSSWQFAMADALGVSTRTINRWAKGERAIPEGILGEIQERVVPERIAALRGILALRGL